MYAHHSDARFSRAIGKSRLHKAPRKQVPQTREGNRGYIRKAPSLPTDIERELLLKINQGLPPIVQTRYDELTAKRRSDTIKAEELQELLGLINLIEKSDAERIRNLAQLAHLRQTSLTALMNDLGIETPPYA